MFDKDEEIGQTITEYANLYKTSDVVTQQEVWDDLMNEISSTTFGNRVLSYYRQIIENYYLQPREEVKLKVNLLEKIKR